MKQFQAGFILDNLTDVFENKSSRQQAFKELAKWCSHFIVDSKSKFEENKIDYDPNFAVLINLIQRGLPTKLNKFAIDFLVSKSSFLSFDDENESSIVINYNKLSDESKDLIFRSLHLIEPRLEINTQKNNYQQSWEKLGSSFEENFVYNDLPITLGSNGQAFIQLLDSQRSLLNIVKSTQDLEKIQPSVKNNFEEQRTDFSIEFPYYAKDKPKGIVIEIDGPQHNVGDQLYLDTERDKIVAEMGWHNTLRIKTSEFSSTQFVNKIKTILIPAINNEYVKNCIDNFKKPIWSDEIGTEIIQLCLIPFGVARIQKTFIEAVAHAKLENGNDVWKIAVLERDIPCGQLAIDDLLKLINSINELNTNPLELPKIELSIFSTNEFLCSNFQISTAKPIDSFSENDFYDLVIDISILERFSHKNILFPNAKEVISIRSVHYFDAQRTTATSELISYKPFCAKNIENGNWIIENDSVKEALDYLLQSVFRKRNFRAGQLPIMHNALQCKSVIGLLPTGGGKSLTYQLSALLQPGICLVIDPIRSLMKDQVDGLLRNNIDSCVFINSTLQGIEKRKAMLKLAEGEVQFVFISPERLQMEEFRILLGDMFEKGLYFSYCIIDEAHCVSEWGHDFRTAYLRLGENAIKYCKTKNFEYLPLFGLTATASYDVLADVQRELSGNDEKRRLTEDAIIRSEYSKRNELQYVIEEVTFPAGGLNTIWDLKKELSSKKQARVKRLLLDIPNTIHQFLENPDKVFSEKDWDLNEKGEKIAFDKMQIKDYFPDTFYNKIENAALIFCPHTKGSFGVTDKFKVDREGLPVRREGYYDILSNQNGMFAGYFMGSNSDSDTTTKKIQEESFENQDKFINNELNLMVATKAFGMGIDKESIRYTIHINYPGSIESYVQEAGRAGRDRKIALSYILFNDQEVNIPTEDEPVDHDFDINMYFHKNSFKGVAKEIAILDELLTEIYFPDRTFELENLIKNEFDTNVKCNYWEGGHLKRLYLNFNFNEPLGYIDLNTLNGFPGGSVNSILSNQIFLMLKSYIQNQNLSEPVYLWIQRSDKLAGIEEVLNSKKIGEAFFITVGFYNNVTERVKTITKWLHDVVHNSFNEATVQLMRARCPDAEAFIEEVCDYYIQFTNGTQLDFEQFCNDRDVSKGNLRGTAYKMFMALYNGYRDKMDTEKAIYRLSTLGVIDDYTVNFSSNTFTLKGIKKTEEEYTENLYLYLIKYYSDKTSKTRLKNLCLIDEPTPIRKALNFLVNFVYQEIQKKRKLAMLDMKKACRLGLEKGSVELKDYFDLYFNSKYARTGYSYFNAKGIEVNASLPDITDNGKKEHLKWVWMFIEIVEEDPKAGQIDNIKHLRGACTRMLNAQPDNYTLLLLNAFALYMLEYKNPRYLQDAETLLINAFINIQEKESEWNDSKLEDVFTTFTLKLFDKNNELETFMVLHGFTFDFDSIMIKRLLNPLKMAHRTLHELNKILN